MLKLHVIKASVNSMPVRVLVRAAGLEFTEEDAYGKTRSEAFIAKCPAHLTPFLEDDDSPAVRLWESCAIMQYLCNKNGLTDFYPDDAAERARTDSAMFYLTGTLYPMLARAVYPVLGFPLYAGEVGASSATDGEKETARRAAQAALAEPLEVFHSWFIGERKFIGGRSPSIADIRLASTLEFLAAIDESRPECESAGCRAAAGVVRLIGLKIEPAKKSTLHCNLSAFCSIRFGTEGDRNDQA